MCVCGGDPLISDPEHELEVTDQRTAGRPPNGCRAPRQRSENLNK